MKKLKLLTINKTIEKKENMLEKNMAKNVMQILAKMSETILGIQKLICNYKR